MWFWSSWRVECFQLSTDTLLTHPAVQFKGTLSVFCKRSLLTVYKKAYYNVFDPSSIHFYGLSLAQGRNGKRLTHFNSNSETKLFKWHVYKKFKWPLDGVSVQVTRYTREVFWCLHKFVKYNVNKRAFYFYHHL